MLVLAFCPLATMQYVDWPADGVADAGGGRTARLVRDAVRADEAAALMGVIVDLVPSLTKLDSTDRLPAYETYVRNHGVDLDPVATKLAPLISRMTAQARSLYKEHCPECHLCTVLLRRYQRSERMRVPSHFDRNALITAVVSLNGGLSPPAFDGGLFLQRTERASSRVFVGTNSTDAVFHSYDLNHGVEVLRGTRYSAVFWFSDGEASCREGTSRWYEKPAAEGSMDAQGALGELYQLGSSGYERDATKAAQWFAMAAEQGSASTQSKLGRMLLGGEGVPQDTKLGLYWVQKAAVQGYAPAEYTMGVACQYGDAEGGLEAAAGWFELAAQAGVASAQYELGVAYINGDGVAAGQVVRGARWLLLAAGQGHADATTDLEALRQDPAWEQVELALRSDHSPDVETPAAGREPECSSADTPLSASEAVDDE